MLWLHIGLRTVAVKRRLYGRFRRVRGTSPYRQSFNSGCSQRRAGRLMCTYCWTRPLGAVYGRHTGHTGFFFLQYLYYLETYEWLTQDWRSQVPWYPTVVCPKRHSISNFNFKPRLLSTSTIAKPSTHHHRISNPLCHPSGCPDSVIPDEKMRQTHTVTVACHRVRKKNSRRHQRWITGISFLFEHWNFKPGY